MNLLDQPGPYKPITPEEARELVQIFLEAIREKETKGAAQ